MEAKIQKNAENLKEVIKKIAAEMDYRDADIIVQATSSAGGSYSSDLYIASVSAPSKEDLKLFAKVLFEKSIWESSETFTLCFDVECTFYTRLAVAFEHLYNKYGVEKKDRLYTARYYSHDSREGKKSLVLENLVAKGFGSFDRFKSIDWNYAAAAITELAKFHALGVAFVTKKSEDLDTFKTVDLLADKNMIEIYEQQALKMGTQVKEEYRSRLQFFLKINHLRNEMRLLWRKDENGFLVHGDYRPSNLMQKMRNGKIKIVPIDYQTCHLGSLVVDLMYFIWTGSDSNFREEHYEQAIEHYYSELTVALKNLHIDINQVYPRKAYEGQLEESKHLGLFLGLTVIALLTVNPEDAPRLNKPEDIFPPPNQLALDRMNGVVGDYIKWGII